MWGIGGGVGLGRGQSAPGAEEGAWEFPGREALGKFAPGTEGGWGVPRTGLPPPTWPPLSWGPPGGVQFHLRPHSQFPSA